ncbi:MAG: PEP-CTERM sorting domain-containing protein [Massilia sp.]
MKRLVLAALLASVGAMANAAVIWDNGLGGNNTNSGYYSSAVQNWRVYDDFNLASNATIGHVFFQMGLTSGAFGGNFTFSVYNYLGGTNVGSQVYSTTVNSGSYTATSNAISSYPFGPFYDVDFNIAPLALGPGSYLVSFYALDMDFRAPNVGGGGSFLQQSGLGAPVVRDGDTPFRLDSADTRVPEPASIVLTTLGLAALGAARRRRAA